MGLNDSCHGLRELRLGAGSEWRVAPFNKVRELLGLEDIQLMELTRADECCGFRGTFAVTEEAVSCMMGKDRIADHERGGAGFAGRHIGALCQAMYLREDEACIRRILGVLSLMKKHGAAAVDDACAAVLELGVADYRPVRRYLDRRPAAPLSLKTGRLAHPRAHPLSRPHQQEDRRRPDMNLVELSRALRQLRLSGMADAVEPRILQADRPARAPEPVVPHGVISRPVLGDLHQDCRSAA